MVRSTVPTALRLHRVAAGLRQTDLAELAELSRETVVNLENGKTKPAPQTVKALAAALGVTGAELFPGLDQ
jgi:transcriptional regulator with XRE-family HTH domain